MGSDDRNVTNLTLVGVIGRGERALGNTSGAPSALSPRGPVDLPLLWTTGLPTGDCTTLRVAHRVHRPLPPHLLPRSSVASSPVREGRRRKESAYTHAAVPRG